MRIKLKQVDEVALMTLGAGGMLAGGAMVYIGARGVRRSIYAAGICAVVGTTVARVGGEIALGAYERLTGKR